MAGIKKRDQQGRKLPRASRSRVTARASGELLTIDRIHEAYKKMLSEQYIEQSATKWQEYKEQAVDTGAYFYFGSGGTGTATPLPEGAIIPPCKIPAYTGELEANDIVHFHSNELYDKYGVVRVADKDRSIITVYEGEPDKSGVMHEAWTVDKMLTGVGKKAWTVQNRAGHIHLVSGKKSMIANDDVFGRVILPKDQIDLIKSSISQLKYHETIFNKWGFGSVFEKGTAVSLLFYGIPGTGKTLTAEVIADYLGKQLKTLSTAEIETSEPGGAERNIKQAFEEANKDGKILLFDECDSLLTDRNRAGIILSAQINVLLSEIERFVGIVIFTTNRLGVLDPALERRITAKIEFEFPNKDLRKQIWKRLIPEAAPIHKGVNITKLAEHEIAGGNIKNAVLNAARMAAYEQSEEIMHKHFVLGVEKEVEGQAAFERARRKAQMVGHQTFPSRSTEMGKVADKGGHKLAQWDKN